MPTIDRTMRTTTDPSRVWDFLSDFRSTEQWDPPTRSTVREAGDGGVGTVYRNLSAVLGRETTVVYTVVEQEPPRRMVLHGASRSFTSVDTFVVGPEGDGSRVRYTAEFCLRGPARRVRPLVALGLRRLGRHAQRRMTRCLDALA